MGKLSDLIGQKFGKLTVIKKLVPNNSGSMRWECRCECGTIRNIDSYTLKNGKATTCGDGKCRKAFKNLTGKRFGKWIVIGITENRGYKAYKWLCKCDCGNIKEVDGELLRKGSSQSCGRGTCHSRFIDIVGKKFGRLTVVNTINERIDGKIAAECKCDCGISIKIKKQSLTPYSSCGGRQCNRTFLNIIGKTYNKLTAIKYTHTRINDYWDFKCECGKTVNILALNVLKGHTKSCGCIKRKNEYKSILKTAFRGHIRGTETRNIKNYLSFEEYIEIASAQCHYCGVIDIRKNKQTGATIYLNGIDRKNNESYYKIENSLPCCRKCNTMKMDMGYREFILKIRQSAKYTENINLDLKAKTEFAQ